MTKVSGKMNGTEAEFELTISEKFLVTATLTAMGQTQKLQFVVKSENIARGLSNKEIATAVESMTFEQVIQAVQDKTFEV